MRSLLLVAGLSYDYLTLPTNFRFAPLAEGEESTERLSPKAGFIWTPTSRTAVRAGYSRSLGGAAFDQSFRLEPSQVAGFSQAFRSVIPESIAGANAGARFESLGVSFEQQCFSNTYVAIGGEHLRSEVNRTLGVFNRNFPQPVTPPFIFQSSTRQHLDYEERTATATINQLLSDEWAVGAQYRVSSAELDITFRDLPASAQFESGLRPHEQLEALLHNVNLFVLFNHPSGFFSQAQAIWFAQDNYEDASHLPGDDFWQFNAFVGYRFARRRIELRVGVLNIADQDYRLNPLNLTAELPRDRTAVASLRFNF